MHRSINKANSLISLTFTKPFQFSSKEVSAVVSPFHRYKKQGFFLAQRQSSSTATSKKPLTSSVSNDEVSKFSSMASTWWDPNQNPLISMNPTRMEFIVTTLEHNRNLSSTQMMLESISTNSTSTSNKSEYTPLKGLKALDVGCGGGLLSESLARLGANVTAIDPSDQVAQAAYQHSLLDPTISNQINYRGGTSVEDLAFEMVVQNDDDDNNTKGNNKNDSLFDVVCILEVIEHATDPHSLIKSAATLLKKPCAENPLGGMLFISTINRTIKSYTIAILGGEYVTGKLPIGTHNWNNFKSPREVQDLVGVHGLKQAHVSGMSLKPPFFDLRWELNQSNTDINWIGAYCNI